MDEYRRFMHGILFGSTLKGVAPTREVIRSPSGEPVRIDHVAGAVGPLNSVLKSVVERDGVPLSASIENNGHCHFAAHPRDYAKAAWQDRLWFPLTAVIRERERHPS